MSEDVHLAVSRTSRLLPPVRAEATSKPISSVVLVGRAGAGSTGIGCVGVSVAAADAGRFAVMSISIILVSGCTTQLVFMTSTVCQFVKDSVFQLVRHSSTKFVRTARTGITLVAFTTFQFVLYSATRTLRVASTGMVLVTFSESQLVWYNSTTLV